MPSYDKEKMLQMLEQQRRSFRVISDLNDRVQERRKDITFQTDHLRRLARSAEAEDYFEKLLALSLDEAIALPREEVEGFQSHRFGLQSKTPVNRTSGISFGAWRELNHERGRLARLKAESERHKAEHDRRFACMGNLKNAIYDWGFRNPENEL